MRTEDLKALLELIESGHQFKNCHFCKKEIEPNHYPSCWECHTENFKFMRQLGGAEVPFNI